MKIRMDYCVWIKKVEAELNKKGRSLSKMLMMPWEEQFLKGHAPRKAIAEVLVLQMNEGKKNAKNITRTNTSRLLVRSISTLALALVCSGCSVHFEVGYHGKTGRDDRIQTQLVKDGDEDFRPVGTKKY